MPHSPRTIDILAQIFARPLIMTPMLSPYPMVSEIHWSILEERYVWLSNKTQRDFSNDLQWRGIPIAILWTLTASPS